MGHYDSCREADEKYEIEKKGAKLRDIILNRTDEEIGQFADAYETIDQISREMHGKEKQHDKLKAARAVLSRFFTKPEKKPEEKKIYSELPDNGTSFLYVVRALKHFTDKFGKSYNSVWGTYFDPQEAKKHAEQSCETSYADEIILEEYELVTKINIGSGVPEENRRNPKP